MTKYEELQSAHQQLLDRSEEVGDSSEFLEEVQAYIEQIKIDAEYVPDARDRNQLRANLRYWASFVYDHTGSYPNTTLRPATVTASSPTSVEASDKAAEPEKGIRSSFTFNRIVYVIILAAITFFVTGYFFLNSGPGSMAEPTVPAAVILPTSTSTPSFPTETATLPDSMLLLTSTPTWTPSPPTRIHTTTGTPVPSQTLTPTLDLNTIEIYKTDVALLSSEVVVHSDPDIVLLPATGQDESFPILLASNKAYMAARLMNLGQSDGNCGSRSLTIAFDPVDIFSEANTSAAVQLSQGGRVIATGQLPFRTGTTTLTLPDSTSNEAVLVQVDHRLFLFETVIVQFYSDCSRNRQILYYRPDLNEEYHQTVPSDLQVSWRMLTWGPSPDDENWITTLQLTARGGDGTYIFWAYGEAVNIQENGLLQDDQLFVSRPFCLPAQLKIGVTSAGQTITRDMVLLVSECVEINHTPTPTSTSTP